MASLKIGVLGTGMVGEALATKIAALGHEVMMGARMKDNEKAVAWVSKTGGSARQGDFQTTTGFGEILVFAVLGSALLDIARSLDPETLVGKVVLDVTNPLYYVEGEMPKLVPELINTTSAGEELQKAHPRARVVKALNTMNCSVMVNPSLVPGDHDVFLCGDDADAKSVVISLLKDFGWPSPIDLGPISAARGMEMMMPMWLRLWNVVGSVAFNYRIVRSGETS